MKNIKIMVIGFILVLVLVAWPREYTENITSGLGLILASVLVAWLGIRHRKSTQCDNKDDLQRYTASTMMKVVEIKESVLEMWEHQDDGSDQLSRTPTYLPTYEYTVNGKTYHYHSRQSLSSKRDLGRQVVGYYDPNQPDCITEDRPRKSLLGGFGFFLFAVIMLYFGIMTITGCIVIS